MSVDSPFLTLVQSCDEAIARVTQLLGNAGLEVVRTFDLQLARQDNKECPCPRHSVEPCDCQMVVLLVYGGENQPISLVAQSFDGGTWFSIVDTPQQRPDPYLEAAILRSLLPQNIVPSNEVSLSI